MRLDQVHVDQIVDQNAKTIGIPSDDPEELALGVGNGSGVAVGDQLDKPLDGRERRAKLVGHRSYEVVLHPVQQLTVGDVVRDGGGADDAAALVQDG